MRRAGSRRVASPAAEISLMTFPPVRYVQAVPVVHDGQHVVVLQDPEGLCPETLAVPLPLYLIMTLLDGRRDARAVQTEIARMAQGQIVPTQEIERIVHELDELYLLENARARERRAELEREFDALPLRPPIHAGAAYPAEADALQEMMRQLFDGLTPAAADAPRPRGLILPHIDLRVGGRALARALATLDADRPPRLYIILGVAHSPTRNLFTLTDKSFATPLGLVETDRDAAARLRELYGAERLSGQIAHRLEHSIEFTTVGLRYLHGASHNGSPGGTVRMLPLLCGSLHEVLEEDGLSPRELPVVNDFIEALRRLIDELNGDVCLIASVDLSHVGLKFGDAEGISDLRRELVRSADDAMLATIERGEPEAFFDTFRADRNARNVDAITSVYVLLHALGAVARAERLDYQQWHEAATDSMVSYASLALY